MTIHLYDHDQQAKKKGPSSEEIDKATPWDDRNGVGQKSEGTVMVFNKGGKLIAAQYTRWELPLLLT